MYAVEAGSVRPLAVQESVPPVLPKPRLLARVREALRVRHYSRRTEEAYVAGSVAISSSTASDIPASWAALTSPDF